MNKYLLILFLNFLTISTYAMHQNTSLHDAVIDDFKKIQALIDKGISPLHVAIECDHIQIIKLLINAGANVNIRYNHAYRKIPL